MKYPSLEEAHAILEEGAARCPGPWVKHSMVAAECARAIAVRHSDLDADRAYVLGLLHDIGRGANGPGAPDVRHIMDGHHLMLSRGWDHCARICMTHSFPIKRADAFAGRWDCPAEEKQRVQDYLDSVEYTAYDQLIQVCDSLALPTGACIMEKRFVDVALRHGFNNLTLDKWRAFLALRDEFSRAIGTSIYTVLSIE